MQSLIGGGIVHRFLEIRQEVWERATLSTNLVGPFLIGINCASGAH